MILYRGTYEPPETILRDGFVPVRTIILGSGEDEPDEVMTCGIWLTDDPILAATFGEHVYEVHIPNRRLLEKIETVIDFEYLYRGSIAPRYIHFYRAQESMPE